MTGPLPRLGIRLHGGIDARTAIALAEAAERSGYASLWLAENPFARAAVPAAAACAAATRLLQIGIGALNPFGRHPTLIAMEAGTLDELSGGRFRLGIGSGIAAAVEQMGLDAGRPLSAVREAVLIVRGMLRGESVCYRGEVFAAAGARLGFAPPRPTLPIFFAAMGDRALALAGEIADGLIVSNLCPPAYTERAVAILRAAAAKAGRPAPSVVQYVPCVALPDGAAAREAAKRVVAEMMAAFWPADGSWPPWRETIVAASGIPRPEFAAALARLRRGEPAAAVLDDRYLAAFAIAGTAEECIALARAYRRAGADELALGFAGPDPAAAIAYLGEAPGIEPGPHPPG